MKPSRLVTGLFLAVFGVSILLFLQLMGTFLAAVVLSLALISLFNPVYRWLLERTGGRAQLAASLTTVLVVCVVIVPLAGFVSSLTRQVVDLYEYTRDADIVRSVTALLEGDSAFIIEVRSLAQRLGFDPTPERIAALYGDTAKAAGLWLYEQSSSVAGNALTILFHFGIMVVVLFTLFVEGQSLKLYLMDLSPLPADEEELLVARFSELSRAVIFGNGAASLLQGLLGGLLFSLFDLGPGVLWGAVIAVMAFLPIVGASIVFIPAAIYLLVQGEVGSAIAYTLLNLLYVGVLEYLLKPRLIGGRAKLPSVLVFLGIVAGLQLFNILGLFYGPLIVTMFLTLVEIYKEHYRPHLLTPLEAEQSVPASSAVPPKTET